VVGVIAGSIDPAERDRIIAADDAYVPISKMDLKGSPFAAGQDPEEQERIRRSYETHMVNEGPEVREIRDFRAEVQNTGSKYAGTRKERRQLMEDLDYAERMMRPSDPDVRNSLMSVITNDDHCNSELRKPRLAADLAKPENRYMDDLMERVPKAGFRTYRPRADKSQDIRKLKNEKLTFSPEYTNAVVGMLRKMEQMQILTAEAAGEESTKVYAFHQLAKAQDELMDAVRSKDREKIAQATVKLKEVRQGMDELMQIARDNFHPSEYMGNLDVVRNGNIPWDYARDVVPSSQINSLYLFGSDLKRNGISIDEFARDPGAAIQKLERIGQEKGNSMKGLCAGKSAGVIAAQAATGTFRYMMQYKGNTPNMAYMRGVGGLILADPGKDPEMRRRNDLIYQKTHEFDATLNGYRMENATLLQKGFAQESERGMDAVRALMLVDVGEADADRMFADPPVSIDGTPTQPMTLADYINEKKQFDYTAQAGRLEEMLTDAARETARLAAMKDRAEETHEMPVYLYEFSREGFNPYVMLQARQEALTQLLVMRAKDKDQPGFQALEEELRHLPERYEALRSANPDLNLPALTQDQKTMLKSGAKAYDDLTINRAMTLEAEEKRIVKAEADKDKIFNRTLKDLNKTVKRRKEQLDKLMRRGASPEEIEAAEEAYTNAYSQRETLKKGRAQAIVEDYKAGKLPEAYASAKLNQLAEMNARGNEPLQTLPVFGAPERSAGRERLRQENRERLLTQSI
ncbi:MAG: hypothetical protein IK096_02740, partial [Lachnospiraceae bacterium]|nr:hypothetical protein [Lachnospiraceae bacterium]